MRRTLLSLAALLLIALPAHATDASAKACTGDRRIRDQAQLNAFVAEGCTSLSGTLDIVTFDLTSLAGLEALTRIGEDLSIQANPRLTSLAGLDNLTSVERNVTIHTNDELTSLAGLENLTSVGKRLNIFFNSALTSLAGLENLTSVGGTFDILGNAALTSFAGLEELTRVGEFLLIRDNTALTSLAGLENLTTVGANLRIQSNAAFASLAGLENLTSVGRDLIIDTNAQLTGCACALKGLATEIRPNTFAFTGVGGDIAITGNGGPTCNTPRSVLSEMAACPTGSAVEGEEIAGFALAQAAPSPTAGPATIRFSLEAASHVRLLVYDVLGREVARLVDGSLGSGAHEASLNGASLPSGVYVYRLTAGGRSLTGTLTVVR